MNGVICYILQIKSYDLIKYKTINNIPLRQFK